MTLLRVYLTRSLAMKPLTQIRIFRLRLAAVVLGIYWVALFTGTHLPSVDFVRVEVSDKTKHFLGFFGLTLLICYVGHDVLVWRRVTRIACLVLGYAMLDEWTQRFVPGRVPDRWDFVADGFGMFAALAVYFACRRFFSRPILAAHRWLQGKLPSFGMRSVRGELSPPHQPLNH